MPKVSVIMPVYNGEKYLKESIESILNQTFSDFEFIIIDDCSTDRSLKIIEEYNDSRIKLIRNEKNIGTTRSLNFGIGVAVGKYIARMDCDDVSMPERFEKQVLFLQKNRDIGVCGSWVETIGDVVGEVWKYPVSSEEIKAYLLFASCIVHPSVMIRKESLGSLRYDDDFTNAQDYELWTRMTDSTIMSNFPEVLLKYRVNKKSQSNPSKKVFANRIREKLLSVKFLGITRSEIEMHNKISNFNFEKNEFFYSDFVGWLLKLRNLNKESEFVSAISLDKLVIYYWLIGSVRMLSLKMLSWKSFWKFLLLVLLQKKQIFLEIFLKKY